MIGGCKNKGKREDENLGDMEMKPLKSSAPNLLFAHPAIQLISFSFVNSQQEEVDYLLKHRSVILASLQYEPDLFQNINKLFGDLETFKNFAWCQTQRVLAREQILDNLNTIIIKSRIRASQESRGGGNPTSLTCSHCYLTRFPGKIFTCSEYETYFKSLKKLSLSKNRLTQLPLEMKQLTSLEVFSLSYNKLSILPPEIGALERLEWLDLSGNGLTELPESLAELPQLRTIYCHGNLVNNYPKNLREGILSDFPLPPESPLPQKSSTSPKA